MDEKVKKFCPNCSQLYRLSWFAPHPKGNIPLFLSCGHTICETCVINIVRFAEPIECKVCHQSTEIKTKDVTKLVHNKNEFYKHFPVYMMMVGELTMEVFNESDSKKDGNNNCFVDLKSIIEKTDYTAGQCIECNQATAKMCQQCETILCNNCFNKSHKNFVVFKNHALVNIEPLIQCNKCKYHTDKTLDYYCKDCSKSICMDCFMVGGDKSCKNHNVASMQEVNEGFLEDLNTLFPKVDETFRRLTKTAVDIGHLLYNTENETGAVSETTQVISDIEQHFSKLNATIQKHKTEVVGIITTLKRSEKESLYKAKEEITQSIKKAKEIINMMSLSLDAKKIKQINLSVLLDDAKHIAETPWYLNKSDVKNESLKVSVNEDLCNLLSDFIHLEGNAKSGYSLRTAAELGDDVEIPPPPMAPVYPPELPKDVRHKKQQQPQSRQQKKSDTPKPSNCKPIPIYQQAPKFRSKTGSTTSINSIGSDSSSQKSGAARFSEAFQRPLVQPVMPFAESKVPKQLHEGAQEIIYISHIVDPHNFYVQRACHQSIVKEMLREFRNSVSSPKPSITHLTEGKLYLMFNAADNMWQRCRINSIDRKNSNKPMCTVFCIDFGSTEVVSIDKLRLLQPGRVQSPPPLAINCSLANCVPKSGSWTCEDSILIQNIVNNKQAVIYIRRIQSTANFAMTLVCDVTTIEEGVSLAHALVFHDRARMSNTKLYYPKICGPSERPKLFMVNNSLKLKTVEEVTITHIFSPDKFFVRERHLQNVFEKLTEDLEQEYNAAVNNENVYLPEIGMVYVVNMEKYRPESERESAGAWARGVALELPGRGRVRVLLADSGAVLLAHWSALRPARPHFTTHRALATECHLAGVTPLNKKWSTASVALLQRFEERVLELHVEDNRNRGSLGVTLYDNSDPENPVCVNNEMIKYKYAISFGLFRFNTSEEQENTDKSPFDEPNKREPKPKTKKMKVLGKGESLSISEEEHLKAKDKGPLKIEVKVLQYQTPSLMYMSLVYQQKLFNDLFDQIQAHYSKTEPSDRAWKEADKCCAFSEESKTWRRAVIMELQDETAKVFYTDFAVVETIPKSQLRELTQEFESLGDAAIKCHLCGVMPAVGTEWPSLTKEYLKELLEVYKRVFITRVGNFKEKSMPVELWVYHTVQGGALEPDTSEWRCLNKKIIDQGLGIPDKSQEATEESNLKNEDDEMLSFLNVTGSVREWLQLEPMPTKPLISNPEPDGDSNPSSPEVCDDVNDKADDVAVGSSNTVFISDWLPAEPLPTTEFTGVPTYIDNDGVVFLHNVLQQDTLELIRKALEVRFKKPDPKAKYAKWTVGEPCIARYFLDNRFYRGRVLEVNPESASCLVQYIDYGNEEVCSFVNMRKSIALHQIPIQAHKCVLARIRPTGNQWDRTTLDYIHKSVVEKQCTIKLAGERIGELIPIELKYDKLWINDHLVDFEMAEYTDGSKAIVRKFAPDSASFKKQTNEDLKSDSGPDYIVDDDVDSAGPLSASHNRSFDSKVFENTDWNLLIQEEENNSTPENMLQYVKLYTEELLCNVTMINDGTTLELGVVHNDEENLRYEEMNEALQKEGFDKPPLKGIYENKSCIALFHEDGQWYRASILRFSKSKGLIKVRYVDYGNTAVVAMSEVREIVEDWTELPPASIQATLYSVTINPQIDRNIVISKLVDTFLDKGPFQAKIVKYENSLPQVELINDDGTLVYSKLISSGYLIPSATDPTD